MSAPAPHPGKPGARPVQRIVKIRHDNNTWVADETIEDVARYRETVKAEAPWLPNTVDFIQPINGPFSRR